MEPRHEQPSRFRIERLEERIAPAHLGHVVQLPPAASHGVGGLAVATAASDAHTRSILTWTLE